MTIVGGVGGGGEQALVHSSHLPLPLGHPQESRRGGGEARFSYPGTARCPLSCCGCLEVATDQVLPV